MRDATNPLELADGTLALHNSCFVVNISEIAPGNPYIFGLKHPNEIH